MKCIKCGSENVTVQMVSDTKSVKQRKSIIYMLCIGWIIEPIIFFIKWFVFTIPAIIFKLFGIGGRKQKIVTTHKKYFICQDCGHSWK